jgi:centromere protein I
MNVSDFVGKLETIELPNQIVAVIGDPLLRKFLLLKSSDSTARRIDNWLLAFFEDQLESQEPTESVILAMLDAIRDYARCTKWLPPACLAYLQSIIPSWNGSTGRETMLDLLSYAPIGSFEELYQSVFRPLEEAVLKDETNESRLALLTFYNTVLRRWTTFLISQAETYQESGPAIESLINHANDLALTIVQTSLDVTTCSAVLTFYETIASLISQPELRTSARITTPPAELIYTLYFSLSLSTVSRLCSILALYKRAFELAMSPKIAAFELQSYPKEYVNHFNGFLMDICNCIWRGRAFNATDMNAMGCLMPAQTVAALGKYVSGLDSSMSLSTLFSLSFSPVFCQAAIAYVREREDHEEQLIEIRHAGPVTQTSLKQLERDGGLKLSWADYRLGVLRHLENEGVPGVGELMYNTMKHLMTARENMA